MYIPHLTQDYQNIYGYIHTAGKSGPNLTFLPICDPCLICLFFMTV